eukprot:633406-Pleurochrysis_carterae.AAC.1
MACQTLEVASTQNQEQGKLRAGNGLSTPLALLLYASLAARFAGEAEQHPALGASYQQMLALREIRAHSRSTQTPNAPPITVYMGDASLSGEQGCRACGNSSQGSEYIPEPPLPPHDQRMLSRAGYHVARPVLERDRE